MKKIECIVRPSKFDAIRDALKKSGVGGMTAYEVSGFGNQRARGRGSLRRMKIEIYVDDFQVDNVMDIVMKHARTGTGETGDGKIAVIDLETLYRIRTGEEGAKAI
ncbi:MAG: transcriptional regulator [Candidatus Omnitrophica bacterium CG11_big_fil_rev_8_21_14_0_20_45_26]|uniref:Transcriptional regulator n=1 Tax=Candidatus Abzuiibacterium crystallinum TaxID=1974748 RepID=A0A2H0LSZ9_9BACT|nr:MAG: transcriptional regulator [Candidatus Omnitrophica bacterium CG11_big_fil_rev_8_21_14_0_20_45_26]PIW64245.1 MAG: transcriptional regulator [Candidatus Omnitrophica bacterium CG12_big_fil_rev_8_21_14_0_65_45_16]